MPKTTYKEKKIAKAAKAKEVVAAKAAKAKEVRAAKAAKAKEVRAAKAAKAKAKKEEEKFILNPMDHIYVPKHEIMAEEEKVELVKRYNSSHDLFPQILFSDPVVRQIGAKPGDMVKITRESPTAGVSEYYRYVVMG